MDRDQLLNRSSLVFTFNGNLAELRALNQFLGTMSPRYVKKWAGRKTGPPIIQSIKGLQDYNTVTAKNGCDQSIQFSIKLAYSKEFRRRLRFSDLGVDIVSELEKHCNTVVHIPVHKEDSPKKFSKSVDLCFVNEKTFQRFCARMDTLFGNDSWAVEKNARKKVRYYRQAILEKPAGSRIMPRVFSTSSFFILMYRDFKMSPKSKKNMIKQGGAVITFYITDNISDNRMKKEYFKLALREKV